MFLSAASMCPYGGSCILRLWVYIINCYQFICPFGCCLFSHLILLKVGDPPSSTEWRGSGQNTKISEINCVCVCVCVCVCLCVCLCMLVTQLCPTLCNPVDCSFPGFSVHEKSTGRNTGVDCCALLQGIFPTQRSNPCLLHSRQILYCLSNQGNP